MTKLQSINYYTGNFGVINNEETGVLDLNTEDISHLSWRFDSAMGKVFFLFFRCGQVYQINEHDHKRLRGL